MSRESFIHVSFDLVYEFIPRVPENRIKGKVNEDSTTPRICVAPDIISALRAIPKAGRTIRFMEDAGLPVIIHVYYLTGRNVYVPDEEEVPDISVTGERWLLKEPVKVLRRDYELSNILFYGDQSKDQVLVCADVKPVKYADNIRNLLDRMGRGSDIYLEKALRKSSFRSFVVSVGDYMLDIIRNKQDAAA